MTAIQPIKHPHSYTVAQPTYSELLQAIIPRNNGTQQGVEALKKSIERSKQR